jgi:hypothetical protein
VRSQTPVTTRSDLLRKISQSNAKLKHAIVRRREERFCGDLRSVEVRSEEIPSARVIVTARGGRFSGGRATEHDPETKRQVVGQSPAHLPYLVARSTQDSA